MVSPLKFVINRALTHITSTALLAFRFIMCLALYLLLAAMLGKEPPVYLLLLMFLASQGMAWAYSEVELYRQAQGKKQLWVILMEKLFIQKPAAIKRRRG